MTNEFPLENMDLALFENGSCLKEFSQLKDFLSFLKLYRRPSPFRFSHVETSGPLIENLTLQENLLLHVTGNEIKDETTQILHLIEHTGNPHLMSFYNKIRLKNSMPIEVDDETRKAMALVKALIQDTDFLFLENPEKFLGKEMLNLFVQALVYKTATTGQIVVIRTRFKNIWGPHFTKRIYRDEKNFFQVNHYSNGLEKTLLNIQNAEIPQEEGFLKIVNPQSDEEEENKKAA